MERSSQNYVRDIEKHMMEIKEQIADETTLVVYKRDLSFAVSSPGDGNSVRVEIIYTSEGNSFKINKSYHPYNYGMSPAEFSEKINTYLILSELSKTVY